MQQGTVNGLPLKQIFKLVFAERLGYFRLHEWIRYISTNPGFESAIFQGGSTGRIDNFVYRKTDNPLDVLKQANRRVGLFIDSANNPRRQAEFYDFLVGLLKFLYAAFYCHEKVGKDDNAKKSAKTLS